MNSAPDSTPGALPLLSDRAYALRHDRLRLESAAMMRHTLARVAYGEGRHADAASAECEAASLELAAAWLHDAEGDGQEGGEDGHYASRRILERRLSEALDSARSNQGGGSREPDCVGIASDLNTAAALRLALAVLAEPQALDNPGLLRLPLAA